VMEGQPNGVDPPFRGLQRDSAVRLAAHGTALVRPSPVATLRRRSGCQPGYRPRTCGAGRTGRGRSRTAKRLQEAALRGGIGAEVAQPPIVLLARVIVADWTAVRKCRTTHFHRSGPRGSQRSACRRGRQ
jgi:hypothetical protein